MDSVGFGKVTGSGFPGESGGILTDYPGWSDIERATLSFGYGLSVTPLQLTQAYSVIASGGLMYPITFQKVDTPQEPERVLAAHAALQVRAMLEAVTGPGGTGQRARISGYRVAGKTGTVRKSTSGGYAEDRYIAVFAGHGACVVAADWWRRSPSTSQVGRNITVVKWRRPCSRR